MHNCKLLLLFFLNVISFFVPWAQTLNKAAYFLKFISSMYYYNISAHIYFIPFIWGFTCIHAVQSLCEFVFPHTKGDFGQVCPAGSCSYHISQWSLTFRFFIKLFDDAFEASETRVSLTDVV